MDSSLHPDVDVLDRPDCHLHEQPCSLNIELLAQLLGQPSLVQVALWGQPEAVNREILNLHHSGYDINAWSEPQRIPGTIDVIAAYTKRSH